MGNLQRLLFSMCFFIALACISYRVYQVLNRVMPPDLADSEKIRYLDEFGRWATQGSVFLHDIGIEPGIEPLKFLINTAFSLLFNPLPWQRVVYRDIRVNQDVYNGVPVSTYTPNTLKTETKGYPTIVYFHGGGWTWLSVGVYDGPLKHLANATKFKIIAVEYRKAPQHPFPASYDDCLAVTRYIIQHSRELNVCKDHVIVAGDGAGGNLAAAVANELAGLIKLQILINPALQMLTFNTPSYQDYSNHSLIGITSREKEVNNWIRYANIEFNMKPSLTKNLHVSLEQYNFLSHYVDSSRRLPSHLQNVSDKQTIHNTDFDESISSILDQLVLDSRFNPMFASDVRNTANTYIITSQYDALRDEALMYGHRLQESGVQVQMQHYWSGFHGFFLFAGGGWIEFSESQRALDDLVQYLDTQVLNIPASQWSSAFSWL